MKKKIPMKVETKLITATPEIFDIIRQMGIFVSNKSISETCDDLVFEECVAEDPLISVELLATLADVCPANSSLEQLFERLGDRLAKQKPSRTYSKPIVKDVKEKF